MNNKLIIHINSPSKLSELIAVMSSLTETDYVSIDTEFFRVTNFYPKLYLVQLCINDCCYLVDPISEIDLKAFYQALVSCKAKFLFFSCREDLEILAFECEKQQLTPKLPKKCVDVQLLMAFLNIAHQKGLQSTISEYLGIELKKDQTCSDWSLRPLTEEQVSYACEDVIYLKPLYEKLLSLVDPSDIRLKWFFLEMELCKEQACKEFSPDDCYKSIPQAGMLNIKQLNLLKCLCKMRALTAMENDEALNRVITTKALCAIAQKRKLSFKTLLDCGMKIGAVKAYGEQVVTWFNQALKLPLDPQIELPYDFVLYQKDDAIAYKNLKKQLKALSHEKNICPELLSNKNLCNDYFYKLHYGQTPILQSSWYLECVGKIELNYQA